MKAIKIFILVLIMTITTGCEFANRINDHFAQTFSAIPMSDGNVENNDLNFQSEWFLQTKHLPKNNEDISGITIFEINF